MKLINKKTREIVEVCKINHEPFEAADFDCSNLAELCSEWEDVPEEPKPSALDFMIMTVTNFIENEADEQLVDLKDCKNMLEKLKAYKRLKEKGFSFNDWDWKTQCISYNLDYTDITEEQIEEAEKDLDLLFSQEDN